MPARINLTDARDREILSDAVAKGVVAENDAKMEFMITDSKRICSNIRSMDDDCGGPNSVGVWKRHRSA